MEWSQSTATAAAASRSADFAERVQILSRNLQEVSSLLEVESRYARVIGSFEKWVTVAQKIRGSRRCAGAKKGKVEAKAELEFIEGLGEGWRSEVAFLERKLMACSREVQKLEAPREREEGRTSTIARIVALLKSAVEGMLEELASVRAIERELLFREATWVKERTARIASDIGDGADVPDSLS